MLTELIYLLDEGRAFSQKELSERLGVSQEAVMAQIEYLERIGILRKINPQSLCKNCSGTCGSCSGCGEDTLQGPAMWEKTSP